MKERLEKEARGFIDPNTIRLRGKTRPSYGMSHIVYPSWTKLELHLPNNTSFLQAIRIASFHIWFSPEQY
jgi:hypothetical protein